MTVDREEELARILEEVRRIEAQTRHLVSDVMAGGYASVFRGAGMEFSEVREYADGDDPRSVDWNVTARMGRPFVKKHVEEREGTVLFLLDLSESMSGGFGAWSARQTAARVCACLALSAARNDDKVGLVAFSGAVEKYVPPKKGLGHVLRIVRDSLALPSHGGSDPRSALDFATRTVRRRAVLFLVSDFLADGWQKSLALCARRHDVIAVRLLAPELSPPERGLWRIRDPEGGNERLVDWSSRSVRESYARLVREWRARTDEGLRAARVDRMDFPVPRSLGRDTVAGPILRFFRMRELRGAKR